MAVHYGTGSPPRFRGIGMYIVAVVQWACKVDDERVRGGRGGGGSLLLLLSRRLLLPPRPPVTTLLAAGSQQFSSSCLFRFVFVRLIVFRPLPAGAGGHNAATTTTTLCWLPLLLPAPAHRLPQKSRPHNTISTHASTRAWTDAC